MYRCTIAALLSFLLVAPVLCQEPSAVPLYDLMLNLDRLKLRGEQRYTYRAKSPGGMEEAEIGTVTFAAEVNDDEIVLTDEMELTYRGEKLSLKLIHHCRRNNYLSPTKIISRGEGDDELGTFVANIEGGKATVKLDRGERIVEIPTDTVSFSALVRLLPLLPREKGNRIKLPHWLESSELNLKKDFMIECLGEDTISRGDQELACTKYQLTGKGIMPMDAWIDSDSVLQRVLIDERKVIDLAGDVTEESKGRP